MWFGKKSELEWREAFVAVVRRTLTKNEPSFEESCTALRNANGMQLLEFDQQARRSFSHFVTQRGVRSSAVLRTAMAEPGHADVFLFYASCDGNGFIREQSLRALRGHAGKLACAAALLRTEDWVSQVAEIAARLLQDLADTEAARHFFELLDLIVAMQSRRRFVQYWSTLESTLLAAKWRDARQEALSSSKAMARRLAHDLILRGDPDVARDTLGLAITDPTPLVAHWALAQLGDTLNPEEQEQLLREGLRSRLSSVRRDSLRRYCRSGFSDARQQLGIALLDRSRSVRSVAAHHFKERFGESAVEYWRKAFDAGGHSEATIAAISDFGEAADEARLRNCLEHPRGRMRALALRGLVRIGAPDSEDLLNTALTDKSAHVVGAATTGYARGIHTLSIENLQRAFELAETQSRRRRLIAASRLLGKWERLEFLLKQYPLCSGDERSHLDEAVQTWIAKSNRSFVTPQPERRTIIAAALESARNSHTAPHWEMVRHLL